MEDHSVATVPFNVHVLANEDVVFEHISKGLCEDGFPIFSAQDEEGFLENLNKYPAELVFADSSALGGIDSSLAKLTRLKAPDASLILIVEPSSISNAVIAVQKGASDYIVKPINPQEALFLARKFREVRRLERENHRLKFELEFLERCIEISSSLDTPDILSWTLDSASDLLDSKASGTCLIRSGSLSFLRARGNLNSKMLRKNSGVLLGSHWNQKTWKISLEGQPLWGQTLFEGKDRRAFLLFDRDPWGTNKTESLKQLLRYTQLGLKNAYKFEKNQDLIFVDDLTGLYNSRYLGQFLDKELKRADRQGYPVSFLFIDLDRFKPINDQHGHLVGSRLLSEVARTFETLVRDVDVLIRYGGDEYVIILINTDTEGAKLVAERIRTEISSKDYLTDMGIDNELKLRLSASLGLATYPRHAKDPKTILQLADEAMYRAKMKSRNAVAVAPEKSLTATY